MKGVVGINIGELRERFSGLPSFLETMPKDIDVAIRSYKKNTVIAQKNEKIEAVGILYSGALVVFNEFENGNIFEVDSSGSIGLVGDIELVAGLDKFVCTVMSRDESSLIYMQVSDFLRWFESDVEFARFLAVRMAKSSCAQGQVGGIIKYHSTEQRVATALCNLAKSFIDIGATASIKITHAALAQNVSSSERTVNRVLSKLKKMEMITLGYGRIVVTTRQYDKLCSYIENNAN